MRILSYTPIFLPPTETFIYSDLVFLSQRHDIEVLCNELTANSHQLSLTPRLAPYRRNWIAQKAWNRLYKHNFSLNYFNRPFHRTLNETVTRFEPDIIHCYFGPNAMKIRDNLSRKDIPIIVNFLGYDASMFIQKSKIYRNRLKGFLKEPNVFTTANANALMENLSRYGIAPAEHRRIFLGIDTEFYKREQPPPPSQPFYLVQTAGLREKKGHTNVLKAFALLKSKTNGLPIRLGLVGGGEMLSKLQLLAKNLGIFEHIDFWGWQSPEQNKKILQLAHAFVHPSITPASGDMEGIPTAIKEAMAMELPIVSTLHSGIPELIMHGEHGLLVPEHDIPALAEAMYNIMRWGPKPKNRTHIIENFTIEKRINALESYYHFAIKKLKSLS